METFTRAREFVKDSCYAHARQRSIANLDLATIDDPITDVVAGFASACASQPEDADGTKWAEDTWAKIDSVFSKSSDE